MKEWACKSLGGGAGAAHKWIKRADAQDEELPTPGDPLADAEAHQASWNKFWVRNREGAVQGFLNAMARLEPHAKRHALRLDPLTQTPPGGPW